MKIEDIIQIESSNDGRTVNLFYDDIAGLYVAYGLSAYYVTMVTDPVLSFSEETGMPLALLNRGHILALRQSLTKLEHTERQYYRFQLRSKIGDAGYTRWKQTVFGKS